MKRGKWHHSCQVLPLAQWLHWGCRAQMDPEPRQQTQERSPLLSPARWSKAGTVSTGKRFELKQNKTLMPRNVPAQGFGKIQCVGQQWGHRGHCHQPALGSKTLWLSCARMLCQEHEGEHPTPTLHPTCDCSLIPSERSWECQRRAPGRL